MGRERKEGRSEGRREINCLALGNGNSLWKPKAQLKLSFEFEKYNQGRQLLSSFISHIMSTKSPRQ